ncbi:MAG: DUF421 domain-containing protein [Clostridia bacterium]|nr:DUF421 domain-containing protein [Clostridia bacterium]MBQ8165108.1 DUF421 domain-containing protein [Clostridia bacterium]
MSIIKIILSAVFSLAVLFLLTKLIGNTQMSQLNMFEYINGITIGSIAAEMATSLEGDVWQSLIAMIIYGAVTFLIGYLGRKNDFFRKFFGGSSVVLYDKGILYKDNFRKSKLDISDFLMRCRINGYFNLASIETAILESNGTLSILPKSGERPATPNDLSLSVNQEHIVTNVIIDGNIKEKNLASVGHNRDWLLKQLKKHQINSENDIFLATYDCSGNLNIYKKFEVKTDNDLFQ